MINFFKVHRFFLGIFAALLLATAILFYSGLPIRWSVSFSIGLIALFIAMSIKSRKEFFLTLFFLSLPMVINNNIGPRIYLHQGGASGFYNAFYDFPLLFLYMIWFGKILVVRSVRLNFSTIDFCVLGLIGTSMLSMINAVDKQLCLFEIFRFIIMFFVFFYMSNNIKRHNLLKYIIAPILFGLFLESCLGIIQYVSGNLLNLGLIGETDKMTIFKNISRVGGTLGHPNTLALYFCFFIPVSICMIFSSRNKIQKFVCFVIFLLSTLTLILTLSRGGWIGFIFSIVVLAILASAARRLKWRHAMILMLVAIILLTTMIVPFKELISTRLLNDDYGSARSRIPLMKVAISIIRAHPFLGVGINNYTEAMQKFDYTTAGISFVFPGPVHNIFLLIAAENGLFGLLFFLFFLILIYRAGFRVIASDNQIVSSLAMAILAGISGFLVMLMIDWRHLGSQSFLWFWTMAGVLRSLNLLETNNYE